MSDKILIIFSDNKSLV
uniref:Uncharacterized protein n=1 Tax=Musa acuminata subsp. malaccensis TaxID=214687 RepID=A0A804HPY7_MUSAM